MISLRPIDSGPSLGRNLADSTGNTVTLEQQAAAFDTSINKLWWRGVTTVMELLPKLASELRAGLKDPPLPGATI
jgi:hypothetical protein